ncbi:MAG TPA: type II toxin-antitoxin system HicB family antitoxin [Myxococcota bacterium]|nr:type II toxin-antitoxin system HicB family antitoxin [Myxococcota bacterium]
MKRDRTTKKETVEAKRLRYTAVFETAEEGGYVVSVPALPGCFTQGETIEEARAMIVEAIEGYLETLTTHGEEIPVEESGTFIETVEAKLSSA